MSTDSNSPDLTEVIDVSTLPGWDGLGGDGARVHPDGDCGTPGCSAGLMALNLSDEADFLKAVDMVETAVMQAHYTSHQVSDRDSRIVLEALTAYVAGIPQRVLAGVLFSIGDSAAGMSLKIHYLECTDDECILSHVGFEND